MASLYTIAGAPRIALYSHDTMGLGHIRRNQLIAMALSSPPLNATVLLISGVREAGAFPLARGIDSLILPAYRKLANGEYHPRSLDLDPMELARMRSALIDEAFQQFKPNVFLADNVPCGAMGELRAPLNNLRRAGGAYCILGLRDILDDPHIVRNEWQSRDNFSCIEQNFDEVWVYGDPAVFPTCEAYAFPTSIAEKTVYTGYLDPLQNSTVRLSSPQVRSTDGRETVLCAVGGGEDGFELARGFTEATLPSQMRGAIATGPLMSDENRRQLVERVENRNDMDVIEGVFDLVPLLSRADRVISMAGYNTTNEILATGHHPLFVPRSRPRMEQVIRANRLAQLGLAEVLPSEEANSEAISEWLQKPAHTTSPTLGIDFGGLNHIVQRTQEIVSKRSKSRVSVRSPEYVVAGGH